MLRLFQLYIANYLSFKTIVERFGYSNSTIVLNDILKPNTLSHSCLIYAWQDRLTLSATGVNVLIYRPEQHGNQNIYPSLCSFLLYVVASQIHLPPVRTLSRLTFLREGVGRYVMNDNIYQRPSATLDASHSPRKVKHVVLDRGLPDKPAATLGCLRQDASLGRAIPAWCSTNRPGGRCNRASHAWLNAWHEIGTTSFPVGGKWCFMMLWSIMPDLHNLPGCGHLAWPRCWHILERLRFVVSSNFEGIAYVH